MLGAGGGGFFLFYVPKDKIKFIKSMSRYLYVPFKFENSGSKIIYQQ
jgi:D-glycero-alpha-D-manno-heptose-7-phosphate kinase